MEKVKISFSPIKLISKFSIMSFISTKKDLILKREDKIIIHKQIFPLRFNFLTNKISIDLPTLPSIKWWTWVGTSSIINPNLFFITTPFLLSILGLNPKIFGKTTVCGLGKGKTNKIYLIMFSIKRRKKCVRYVLNTPQNLICMIFLTVSILIISTAFKKS